MTRYYFTTPSKDEELYEVTCSLEEALIIAESYAKQLGDTVYINEAESECIIDCAFP